MLFQEADSSQTGNRDFPIKRDNYSWVLQIKFTLQQSHNWIKMTHEIKTTHNFGCHLIFRMNTIRNHKRILCDVNEVPDFLLKIQPCRLRMTSKKARFDLPCKNYFKHWHYSKWKRFWKYHNLEKNHFPPLLLFHFLNNS
jgi:hypothetical protein